MFEWSDLRPFLAVARAGSLSAAARALGVNHSTVFRRIAALESALGVRLFDRLPNGYGLTAAGEEMLERAARVEQEILGIDRRIAGQDVRPSGSIRVSTADTIAYGLLPRHLMSFREANPGITVELAVENRFVNLTKREADVALRPSRDPDGDMVGRRVSDIAFAVYGAPDYLATRGLDASAFESPEALDGQAFIDGDDGLRHLASTRWVRDRVPSGAIVLRANNLTAQLMAARAGIGLAVLPCFCADPDPILRRLLPPIEELTGELWLLTHPDLRRAGRIRTFLDFMADAIAVDRPLLEGRLAA